MTESLQCKLVNHIAAQGKQQEWTTLNKGVIISEHKDFVIKFMFEHKWLEFVDAEWLNIRQLIYLCFHSFITNLYLTFSLQNLEKNYFLYNQSEAQELTTVKMSKFGGGIGVPTTEERLKEAAEIHLRLGQIQRYCELMVELGEVICY